MKFTKKEEDALLKIPFGRESTSLLKQFAKSINRSYGTVWQKRYSLHKLSSHAPKTNKSVPAMQFAEVDFVDTRSKVDKREELSMMNGLDQAIKGPLANKGRGILFPKRLMGRAKKYLAKKYSSSVYSFHGRKGDKTNVVLTKRM